MSIANGQHYPHNGQETQAVEVLIYKAACQAVREAGAEAIVENLNTLLDNLTKSNTETPRYSG